MSTTGHDPQDTRFDAVPIPTPIPTSAGLPVLVPEPKRYVYQASPALGMTFTPIAQGVTVTVADGGPGSEAVVVVGSAITLTVDGGTSTNVSLAITWAASAAASALASLACDVGTIPVGAAYGPQALATTRVAEGVGMIGHCTDGSWRPVRLLPDGSLEVSVTIGDTIKTNPYLPVEGATPSQLVAVSAQLPEPKTWEYDTGLFVTFSPKVNGLSVGVSDTGAETVVYGGHFITVTLNGGASSDVSLAATWGASDAAAVCDIAIDAGTFPVGATLGPTELWTDRTVGVAARVGLAPDGEYVPEVTDDDGKAVVREHLIPIGAATTPTEALARVGVTGRLPKDRTFTISAGNDITIHPLVGGVSVIIATAGAAAVSATGKVVTLTSKNDDSTTVAAMQALIAASASVAALLTIDGTGTDTFDHLLVLAEAPLWTTGTIPANALIALGSDGYWWPVIADDDGNIKCVEASADDILTAAELLDDVVNPVTDSARVEEIAPVDLKNVAEELLADTALTVGAPGPTYYYPSSAGHSMDGYKSLSVDFYLQAGAGGADMLTLTVESTDDPTGAATWVDITAGGDDLTVAPPVGSTSYVSTAGSTVRKIIVFSDLNCALWRVKAVVATNNAQHCAIRSRCRAL